MLNRNDSGPVPLWKKNCFSRMHLFVYLLYDIFLDLQH